jgi:hypothetical protein
MARGIILLFIFILGIFFLVTIFAFDFATSVIPGWHTTILAPQQLFWLPIYPCAAFVIACYITSIRKRRNIPTTVLVIYFLFAMPYPLVLLWCNYKGSQGYEWDLMLMPKLIISSLVLFIIGHLIFLYCIVKMIRKK